MRECVARRRSESLAVSTMRASGGQPVDDRGRSAGIGEPLAPLAGTARWRQPRSRRLLVFGQDLEQQLSALAVRV